MKRFIITLALLVVLLPGCMAPMTALKITYMAVSTVARAIDVLASDEPEPEEGEDDGEED